MSTNREWNDKTREELRDRLCSIIKGELRLSRREHKEILDFCCLSSIQDECPRDEQNEFLRFASGELEREIALLEQEKSSWPEVTDCDRLDRVEASLRDQGILLWQVSPCCDTCTYGELPDRLNLIENRYPGFRKRFRGFAFFIDQTLPDRLTESTKLDICLGYTWYSSDGRKVSPEIQKMNALEIAQAVCTCLRDHGFKVDWNGDTSQKICVSLNWQRRTILC